MLSIKLFGGAALEVDGDPLAGPAAQRHRLALLALLAASPSRAVTRDKLMAYLWAERDSSSARKLLNQSVYALRKRLGKDVILSVAEELHFDASRIRCDLIAFEEALADGELQRAVELYSGPFLDGFFLDRARRFEHWVERQRRRLADAYAGALEQLAKSAEGTGDVPSAVKWWKALAIHDPYDSRVAVRLVESLKSAGNPAGAVEHAIEHERRLKEELGVDPPLELGELVDRLQSERPPFGSGDRGKKGLSPSREPSVPAVGGMGLAGQPAARVDSPDDSEATRPDLITPASTAGAVLLAAAIVAGLWLSVAPSESSFGSGERGISLNDIERVVAGELDRRLGDAASAPSREARTENIAAYELYLRGTDPSLLRNDSTVREGIEYLREAIALDSTYAAPPAGLACLYLRLTTVEDTNSSRERLRRLAEDEALRAVELDDSLSEAHASLGLVRMAGFDFSAAERHLRSAIDLNPDRTRPREWLVTVYLAMGRPVEALEEAEEALAVNPLSPTANAELARALAANGRCDEALTQLRKLVSLQPPLLRAGTIAAHCYAQTGRLQEAVRVLRPQAERSSALLGHMLARAGQREEALRILEGLESRWLRDRGGAFPVAMVEAGLGDRDNAFSWLDRAVEDGSLVGVPPHLQILRTLAGVLGDDPRYQELRQELHLGALP